jgi:hypothetical protein
MLTWIFKRWLNKFEREWDYDVTYMRTVLDECGPDALAPFSGVAKVSAYKKDAPPDVYYTAALLATRNGDCGPCLQLVANMAHRAHVPPAVIRAVLAGDREAMPENVQLTYDFTRAVLARDGWDGAVREELRKRFGPRAIVSLSYAIAIGGFYPAFKYAYGVGHACQRVQVGNIEVVPQAL